MDGVTLAIPTGNCREKAVNSRVARRKVTEKSALPSQVHTTRDVVRLGIIPATRQTGRAYAVDIAEGKPKKAGLRSMPTVGLSSWRTGGRVGTRP